MTKATALLASFPSPAHLSVMCNTRVWRAKKGSDILLCASTIFIPGFVGYITCVHAEGLAWIIFSPLYFTHSVKKQTTQVTLMSHLQAFIHGQLEDVNLGWGQTFTNSLHGIPQAQYHMLLSAACLVHVLNFVSGGLLTYFGHFRESSPVQCINNWDYTVVGTPTSVRESLPLT